MKTETDIDKDRAYIARWFTINNPGTVARLYIPADRTPFMVTLEQMMESPSFWAFDDETGEYIPQEEHWPLLEEQGFTDPDFIVAYVDTVGCVEFEIR